MTFDADRDKIFQLTPSRRATILQTFSVGFFVISTHALTEGDVFSSGFSSGRKISTHALTEGDIGLGDYVKVENISTHALTEGDDIG